MPTKQQLLGKQAEDDARIYLETQGLKFVTNNYLCKLGEIDLIMQDGESLVFVEVRYRKSNGYGDGIDSISKSKQCKIISAAKCYLLEYDLFDKIPCRFDVIAASFDGKRNIEWVKNAFWFG